MTVGYIYNPGLSDAALGDARIIRDQSVTWLTADGNNSAVDARHRGKDVASYVDAMVNSNRIRTTAFVSATSKRCRRALLYTYEVFHYGW